MPIEARQRPGFPGISAGLFGFSIKSFISPVSSTRMTPNLVASSLSTSTQPMVTGLFPARCSSSMTE